MNHPPHVFVFAGVIAMVAFAFVVAYATAIEFSRPAMTRTVGMGPAR